MPPAQGVVQTAPTFPTPIATPPIANIVASAAQVATMYAQGTPVPKGTFLVDPTTLLLYGQSNGAGGYVPLGGGSGIPVMWGPFTASGVVKGVAGDPGTVLAVFCSASASGNITMRNSATVGGGTPLVGATAVAMSAGQMLVIGPQDCANGVVLDLNSGTGTFYVIGY